MYAVSEAFQEAIKESSRNYYYTGSIFTKDGKEYPFTNNDIVKGSGYLTSQCSGNTEIELGTVYASELGITLYSDIDRYSLQGGTISLMFHLQLKDGSYETVPMGIYEISEANRTIKCLEIRAYDFMLRLEKKFNHTLTSGTPYEILTLISEQCGVELSQTLEEIEAFPNGTEYLGIYVENDIETYRDLLYYLSQTLGCFALFNRQGKLTLKAYGDTSVVRIGNKERFSSSFSDFVTRYTAVSVTNQITGTAEYYALEEDNGLTMNLSTNPFLQYGLPETRERIIGNILTAISKISYIPFDATTIGNPALDVGDVVQFADGQADETAISCITSINTKVNGKQTLKGVGKNTNLAHAKSKNDKNIVGLLSTIDTNKVNTYTYVNARKYTVMEKPVEIISMEYASNQNTDAQFLATVLLTVATDPIEKMLTGEGVLEGEEETTIIPVTVPFLEETKAVLKVIYIFDDVEKETYYPVEEYLPGQHILNLFYPLSGIVSDMYHTLRVRLSVTGGTVTIQKMEVLASISGQGLASSGVWDGTITVEDTYEAIGILKGCVKVTGLKEVVAVGFEEVQNTDFADTYVPVRIRNNLVHLSP